jgi:hypothetical protein
MEVIRVHVMVVRIIERVQRRAAAATLLEVPWVHREVMAVVVVVILVADAPLVVAALVLASPHCRESTVVARPPAGSGQDALASREVAAWPSNVLQGRLPSAAPTKAVLATWRSNDRAAPTNGVPSVRNGVRFPAATKFRRRQRERLRDKR